MAASGGPPSPHIRAIAYKYKTRAIERHLQRILFGSLLETRLFIRSAIFSTYLHNISLYAPVII